MFDLIIEADGKLLLLDPYGTIEEATAAAKEISIDPTISLVWVDGTDEIWRKGEKLVKASADEVSDD